MSPHTHQSIAHQARQLWLAQPVFLDTETTGLHNSAEIVEIGIIDHDGSVLLDTLVRPRRPIPADAIDLHGITNEMVRDAPTWLQVWPDVQNILTDRCVGIYNADFDLRMMQQSHQANGMPWRGLSSHVFCIMKLYADFHGSYKWQKLEAAGRQCGISLPNSHRAMQDTLLVKAVFHHIVGNG